MFASVTNWEGTKSVCFVEIYKQYSDAIKIYCRKQSLNGYEHLAEAVLKLRQRIFYFEKYLIH